MKKYLFGFLIGLSFLGTSVYALSILQVSQGGTGAATLTGCLTGHGTGAITGSGSACGSGGGGSGGGPMSSTTITGSANYFVYPNNATDVVGIGSTSGTSTSKFFFDPNTLKSFLSNASTTIFSADSTTGTSTIANALKVGTGAVTSKDALWFMDCSGRVWLASASVGGCGHINNGTVNTGPALELVTGVGATSASPLLQLNVTNAAFLHSGETITYGGAGDGLTITGAAASSNAASFSNAGLDHTIISSYIGSTANKGAGSFTSTNAGGSTLQVTGVEDALAALKVSQNSTSNSPNSYVAALQQNGTAGGGLFVDTTSGYTGQLATFRINGAEKLGITSAGVVGMGYSSSTIYSSFNVASSTSLFLSLAQGYLFTGSGGKVGSVSTTTLGSNIFATSTNSIYIDSSRVDTYTANGTILYPYTSITAANSAVVAAALTSATYRISPGTSYAEQSITFPNIPLVIYGQGATIIAMSGASLGAGTLTFSNDITFYDPVVFGNVALTSSSLTNPHSLINPFIAGNVTFSGNAIFFNGAIVDQNATTYPFLSQTASSTFTINAGALVGVLSSNVQSVITNKGTLNFNSSNMTVATSTRYAIDSSTVGSVLHVSGASLQNLSTGGGIDLRNSAPVSAPNAIDALAVVEGVGSTNGIETGTSVTFINDYNITTLAGVSLYATPNYSPSSGIRPLSNAGLNVEGNSLLNVTGGATGLGTTTPAWPLQVATSSTAAGFKPQLTLTDTAAAANLKHWFLSSLGGNFYIGTSTDAYATSTRSALQIDTNGKIIANCFSNDGSTCISGGGLSTYDAFTHPSVGTSATSSGIVAGASSTVVGLFRALGAGLGKAPSASIRTEVLVDSTFTQGVRIEADLTTRLCNNGFITGDAQVRFTQRCDGLMGWGPGTAVTDTNLYRFSTSTLATDHSFLAAKYGGFGTTTQNLISQVTIASSTAPQLALSNGAGFAQWVGRNLSGNLYFATTSLSGEATTTTTALEIAGNGFGTTTVKGLNISGQATSTSNVGFNITTGCYAILGTCISGGAGGSGDITSVGDVASGAAFDGTQGTTLTFFNAGGNATLLYDGSMFETTKPLGIATTTGNYPLEVYGTASQLSLSNGAGLAKWTLANEGGNLYISTTTVAGNATTTTAALSILSSSKSGLAVSSSTPDATLTIAGSAGNFADLVYFGSSTAYLRIDNSGHVFLPNITKATGGTNQTTCYVSATGELVDETTTACAVSSIEFKNNRQDLDFNALDKIMKLKPVSFSMKSNVPYDYQDTQYGLIAEEVAQVDPHFAEYGENNKPRNLDDRALLSTAIKAIQELAVLKGVKQDVQENWQNGLMFILFLYVIYNEVDKKLKFKITKTK